MSTPPLMLFRRVLLSMLVVCPACECVVASPEKHWQAAHERQQP